MYRKICWNFWDDTYIIRYRKVILNFVLPREVFFLFFSKFGLKFGGAYYTRVRMHHSALLSNEILLINFTAKRITIDLAFKSRLIHVLPSTEKSELCLGDIIISSLLLPYRSKSLSFSLKHQYNLLISILLLWFWTDLNKNIIIFLWKMFKIEKKN